MCGKNTFPHLPSLAHSPARGQALPLPVPPPRISTRERTPTSGPQQGRLLPWPALPHWPWRPPQRWIPPHTPTLPIPTSFSQPATLRTESDIHQGYQSHIRSTATLSDSPNLPLILMGVISPQPRPRAQGQTHCFSGCCQSFHLFMGDPDISGRLQAERKPSWSQVWVPEIPLRPGTPRARTHIPSPESSHGPSPEPCILSGSEQLPL